MFVHQLGEFAKYPITIYSVAVQALIVIAVALRVRELLPHRVHFRRGRHGASRAC